MIRGDERWRWAAKHPHLAFPPDPANTLYVARERLSLPGLGKGAVSGSGTFETIQSTPRLTRAAARSPLDWSLPSDFLPGDRPPLTYHRDPGRWSSADGGARLRTASRGQEFVLDLNLYPGVLDWVTRILTGSATLRGH